MPSNSLRRSQYHLTSLFLFWVSLSRLQVHLKVNARYLYSFWHTVKLHLKFHGIAKRDEAAAVSEKVFNGYINKHYWRLYQLRCLSFKKLCWLVVFVHFVWIFISERKWNVALYGTFVLKHLLPDSSFIWLLYDLSCDWLLPLSRFLLWVHRIFRWQSIRIRCFRVLLYQWDTRLMLFVFI